MQVLSEVFRLFEILAFQRSVFPLGRGQAGEPNYPRSIKSLGTRIKVGDRQLGLAATTFAVTVGAAGGG